jgi:hypothetical protein
MQQRLNSTFFIPQRRLRAMCIKLGENAIVQSPDSPFYGLRGRVAVIKSGIGLDEVGLVFKEEPDSGIQWFPSGALGPGNCCDNGN